MNRRAHGPVTRTEFLAKTREMLNYRTRKSYSNAAEEAFRSFANRHGMAWTKRGWPDFLVITPDLRIMAIEVKPHGNHPLKKEQRMVMDILAMHGIECRKWSPDNGLEE